MANYGNYAEYAAEHDQDGPTDPPGRNYMLSDLTEYSVTTHPSALTNDLVVARNFTISANGDLTLFTSTGIAAYAKGQWFKVEVAS